VDVVAAVGFALGLIWLVMLGQGLNRACRPKIANKLSAMIEKENRIRRACRDTTSDTYVSLDGWDTILDGTAHAQVGIDRY
jgi:hypothetical protein